MLATARYWLLHFSIILLLLKPLLNPNISLDQTLLKMPTDLPYAADAQESLAFDELEVSLPHLAASSRPRKHIAVASDES